MPELYLRLLDRIISPILLLLSIYLLFRGHNEPGGGFIAGLAAVAAIQLQILGRGEARLRRWLGPLLHPLTGLGLLMAVVAALLGLFRGSFFAALWWFGDIGDLHIELGTPILFDIGVYLVVVSVINTYLLGLARQERRTEVESREEGSA
jgi:multicomponent Na+:H+ antiporter subunit B